MTIILECYIFSPTDIPECSQSPNPCSQYCVEEEGSYSCTCNETGYQLDVDQKTCIGKNELAETDYSSLVENYEN